MDENIWENPKSFNPERFLDAQNNIINSEKVLPFGTGESSFVVSLVLTSDYFKFVIENSNY